MLKWATNLLSYWEAERSEAIQVKTYKTMKQILYTRNELYSWLIELDKAQLLEMLNNVAKKYKYPIFKSNKAYPINLNIWGIRSNDERTEYFNDVIIVFYNDENDNWTINIYEATTDPGRTYLMNPCNEKGCAVLTTGFHQGLWKLGYHKGTYKALVQASPCLIYRDYNRDDIIDFHEDLRLDRGMFGLNLHRASSRVTSDEIGLYSAGCQVIKNANEFDDLIQLCEKALKDGDKQSYVLIHEDNLT